ncbi:hypothetical protein L1887_18659 [Cichorium endivia]|nr:hypothetical protein L1887_18659 [Cichorium endivia]
MLSLDDSLNFYYQIKRLNKVGICNLLFGFNGRLAKLSNQDWEDLPYTTSQGVCKVVCNGRHDYAYGFVQKRIKLLCCDSDFYK